MAAPSRVLASRSTIRFRPPRFGLGGSHLGEPPGPDADATAVATVDAAYQAGIRFFDTSPEYGDADRRLGTALRKRPRDEYLLSTHAGTAESIHASTDRLQLAIDLAFAADEVEYRALDGLRRDGTIKAVGAVSADWAALDRLVHELDLDCVLLTAHYSLLDQSAKPLLDKCSARGVAVVVAGVLTPEILRAEKSSTGPAILARRISAVCERYDVSLPQAALAYPGRHPAVTSVLIAASTPAEIRADVALVRRPVPEKLWHDPELLRLLS